MNMILRSGRKEQLISEIPQRRAQRQCSLSGPCLASGKGAKSLVSDVAGGPAGAGAQLESPEPGGREAWLDGALTVQAVVGLVV